MVSYCKKIFILLLLFVMPILGQKGSTATPYSIEGWDAPVDSTQYYNLFIFSLMSNPGGWLSLNTVKIDSLLNALVVFTDTSQMQIENDILRFSDYMSGHNSFNNDVQYDTVEVIGMDSLDVVIVSAREAVLTANDLLSVKVEDGQFIVQRPASGTSNLKYNWVWIKKYD